MMEPPFRSAGAIAGCLAAIASTSSPIAAQTSAPEVVEWAAAAPLPLGVGGHTVWTSGDRIWCAGGTYWEGGEKQWARSVWSWRPGAPQWDHPRDLPAPLAYPAASVAEDHVFLAGGCDGESMSATLLALDIRSATANVMEPALPTPVVYAGAGRSGGSFYVIGGASDWRDFSSAHDRAYRLGLEDPDPFWQVIPNVPGGPRALPAATGCGGRFYVFGGAYKNNAGQVINHASAHAWLPAERRWQRLRDLPVAGRGITGLALDDRFILLIGGFLGAGGDGDFSSQVLVYDTKQDTYRPTTSLPYRVATAGAILLGDKVYVLGGEDAPRSRTPRVVVGTARAPAGSVDAAADPLPPKAPVSQHP